ncbi:CopG family transcriptional regulator/antitoxin EndoAI [Clostridium acetobutylicum]|nr:CopG family transcriptional regulator/antitoxin EndoAI [Clostridium acetobutylicum]
MTSLTKHLRKIVKKRSEFIREAIILYIEERKKLQQIELVKKGYSEMAKLNIEICECGFSSDLEDLNQYEVMLSESDLLDDNSGKTRRYILC